MAPLTAGCGRIKDSVLQRENDQAGSRLQAGGQTVDGEGPAKPEAETTPRTATALPPRRADYSAVCAFCIDPAR